MKRLISTAIGLLFAFAVFADKRAEVTILQVGIKLPVNTYLDNGDGKVKDIKSKEGKKFKSAVAAINHFVNDGWEIKEMYVSVLSIGNIIRVYVLTKKEENTQK